MCPVSLAHKSVRSRARVCGYYLCMQNGWRTASTEQKTATQIHGKSDEKNMFIDKNVGDVLVRSREQNKFKGHVCVCMWGSIALNNTLRIAARIIPTGARELWDRLQKYASACVLFGLHLLCVCVWYLCVCVSDKRFNVIQNPANSCAARVHRI